LNLSSSHLISSLIISPHRIVQVINWMDETSAINSCPGAGFTANGTNQTLVDAWVRDTINRTHFDGYDGLLFGVPRAGRVIPDIDTSMQAVALVSDHGARVLLICSSVRSR
jgi:hypothetical protein